MPTAEQFPCLGLSALGMCSYDPAQPANIYFSLGEATAALAFTFAIQQFIRPIYKFRLRTYGIKLWHLLLLVLSGALCAVIAAILPNVEISRTSFLHYPIFWELIGAILIVMAYAVSALIALVPAHIYAFNLISFVRTGAALLSAADDADRVSFAEDLLSVPRNMEGLIKYAGAWERAEAVEDYLEIERLRSIGAPTRIQGPSPVNAFYRFEHRVKLERASYAGSFLRILSDQNFCSVLVRRCPWLTAATIEKIAQNELHTETAVDFIQEIARQAIVDDESMMAKEISYEGFGTAPRLSNSLFKNRFLLSRYRPLNKLRFEDSREPTGGYIARLNGASEMMLRAAIKGGDYWPQGYMYDVEMAYKHLFSSIRYRKNRKEPSDFPIELQMGISALYRMLVEALATLEAQSRNHLFVKDPKRYQNDLVNTVTSIVYESFSSIASSFVGHDGPNWDHAISTFMDLYPSHDGEPAGLNPLQQQLAIKLIEKLQHNMAGYYPAISRILLAVIGPYEGRQRGEARTAYEIIRDAAYIEFKKLHALYVKKPNAVADYLPANVTFDANANVLIHTYTSGETTITDLAVLNIPAVNLFDETLWQLEPCNQLNA